MHAWIMIRFYILMLITVATCNAQHYSDKQYGSGTMFIKDYYVTKRIARVTAFVCWGKRISSQLIKELSNAGIQSHFVEAQYDIANAIRAMKRLSDVREWWPVGVLLDASCHCSELLLNLASQNKIFNSKHFWLVLHDLPTLNTIYESKESINVCDLDSFFLHEINCTFSTTPTLIDSEVTFVIQRVRVDDSQIVTPIVMENDGFVSDVSVCQPRMSLNFLFEVIPGIGLPHLFTEMHDLKLRHFDTWTKINYIIVENMAQDLNFTLIVTQFNTSGYQTNGSFDGLVGALERKELDLGATGLLFKEDRLMVMDYVGETYTFRASIIFRQPSLASITNIFLQPFSTKVWICVVLMFVVSAVALTIQMKAEGKCQQQVCRRKRMNYKENKNIAHWGEVVMMVVGAVCQQGFYSPPSSLSARTTFLALWMASLFLFTSYAASVVVLLQTPSHLVSSLADLLNSPVEVGIQDHIYNHVFFRETTDPLAMKLYHEKIEPHRGSSYYSAVEGMQKVQRGLFAFQVEHTIGYKIISETFTEGEKCGLGTVDLLPSPSLGIPIVHYSPYKEILAQKLLHLRELGILDRTWKQWIPQKPSCTHSRISGPRHFVSIGLDELHYSFSLLEAGAIIAVLLMILERLIHQNLSRKMRSFSYRN